MFAKLRSTDGVSIALALSAAICGVGAGFGPNAPGQMSAGGALGIVVAAAAAFTARRGHRRVARTLAVPLLLAGTVLVCAHLARPGLTHESGLSKLPSLYMAIAVTAAAGATLTVTFAPLAELGWIFAGLLGALATFVGLMPLADGVGAPSEWQANGSAALWQWLGYARTVPLASTAFVCLGILLCNAIRAGSRRLSVGSARDFLKLPLLAGSVVLVGTLFIWQALLQREVTKIHAATLAQSQAFADRLSRGLEERVSSLERMAQRVGFRGAKDQAAWAADARHNGEYFADTLSLAMIDPDYRVRWIHPYFPENSGIGYSIAQDPAKKKAADEARAWMDGRTSAIGKLRLGGEGFATFAPFRIGEKFGGWVASSRRLDAFLTEFAPPAGYAFRLIETGRGVASSSGSAYLTSTPWAPRLELHARSPVSWAVELAPLPETVRSGIGGLPTIFLLAGLATAFTLSTLTHLMLFSRRQTRLAVRLSERMRALMELAPIGIFQADAAGRIVFVNQRWTELTGVSAEQAAASGSASAIHPEDRTEILRVIAEAVRTATDFEGSFRYLREGGEVRWVDVRAIPLRDDEGGVTGFIGTTQDFTERKRAEELIERQRLRFVHTERMSALGEMAAGMAHEVNNPLAIITGYAEKQRLLIEHGRFDDAQALEVADVIANSVERVARIIRGLHAFARSGDGDAETSLTRVPIIQVIDSTLDFCRARFRNEGITLRIEPFDESLEVDCRVSQISQALLNLLGNAFDAVSKQPGSWVTVSVAQVDSELELAITDSGPRITDEVAQRMLQPFFTTKKIGSGTGLGLSIAAGLLQAHGGRLWLDRTHAHTRMVFRMPLRQGNGMRSVA